MVLLKSEREIGLMRDSAKILKEVFLGLKDQLKPGIRTKDIDLKAERLIRSLGAESAFLGYRGFPASVCISVNDEVVHGIPRDRIIKDGDIVSLDMGVKYKGYCSDAARTWPVGKVSDGLKRLIQVTRDALYQGIGAVKLGGKIGDVSHSVQQYVEKHGYGVVRDFVGHGIGRNLHEDPQVPNYGSPGRGIKIEEGLVIAIEPMVNMGKPGVRILEDGWTVVTEDGSVSAHFEETVAMTKNGLEVLTRFEKENSI